MSTTKAKHISHDAKSYDQLLSTQMTQCKYCEKQGLLAIMEYSTEPVASLGPSCLLQIYLSGEPLLDMPLLCCYSEVEKAVDDYAYCPHCATVNWVHDQIDMDLSDNSSVSMDSETSDESFVVSDTATISYESATDSETEEEMEESTSDEEPVISGSPRFRCGST